MEILVANPRGFCAGVDRAIDITERAIKIFGAPIYVKHEIVHNNYVVKKLKDQGVIFIEDLNEVPEDSVLIFSAHGVSNNIEHQAKKRKLKIFDATCPLVTKVHMEVQRYSDNNINTILIGHNGHPEVEGTLGRYNKNNNSKIILVESIKDVEELDFPINKEIAYVTQTTLSIDDTKKIIDSIRKKYKNIVEPKSKDICYATQNRQNAVKKLTLSCDLILVVGSKNSSNSNRLKEISENVGIETKLIDSENDIKKEWFADKKKVGLTAGASAPEILVESILNRLKEFNSYKIIETDGIEEKITFKIPKELKTVVSQ